MNIYAEQIIELYKNPLNKRAIKNADIKHSGVNVACGDHLRIYLKLDKKKKVTDASFKGEGCSVSIAAASLLTEELKNKSLPEIAKMGPQNMFKLLKTELSPARVKCGVLALEAAQEGIKLYRKN